MPRTEGERSLNPFMSPNEVGVMLGITGEAVKQWIYSRRLPAIKLSNGYWKIKADDLQRFLECRTRGLNLRILVLDSDIARCTQTVAVLRELNVDVITSNNELDALLKIKEFTPRVFIVAKRLDIDVWKFVAQLRKSKSTRKAAVLMLSEQEPSPSELETALVHKVNACVIGADANELRREVEFLLQY